MSMFDCSGSSSTVSSDLGSIQCGLGRLGRIGSDRVGLGRIGSACVGSGRNRSPRSALTTVFELLTRNIYNSEITCRANKSAFSFEL